MKKKIITLTLNPCIDKTIVLNGFCEGGLNRAESVRVDAGGKGINVAKVLKRFGAEVLALGVMGEAGSHALIDEMDARGIAHDFLKVDGEVRTNYKLQDNQKAQVTEVNEPGFRVDAGTLEAVKALIDRHLDDCGALVLAGSLARGFSPETYQEFIYFAKEKGVKVILDADGAVFAKALEAQPYAVKPNRFELEQLFGRTLESDEDLLACGRKLIEKGISLVVISLGGEGAMYVTENAALRVHLAPIACQSTVGAGDSMVAAVAHCLAEEKPLTELAQMASAAGTITASKAGTEVCTLEEVLAYRKKLTVIEL